MIKSKSVKTISFLVSSFLIFIAVFYLVVNVSKPITIIVNGIEINAHTLGNTVEEVLGENDIVLKDGGIVFPSRFSKISGGETIIFDNPVPVILYLGNDNPREVMTTSQTVSDFLENQGIELGDRDVVSPSLEAKIIPDLEIVVKYIDMKVEHEEQDVAYDTIFVYNDGIYEGNENTIQEGKNGIRVIKKQKYYENGIETGSEVFYDNIDVEPIDKIVEKGTKKREVLHVESSSSRELIDSAYSSGSKINFLGEEYSIAYTKLVEATAFYDSGSNGNHTTATGNPTVYNPSGWSTIAVDPKVIPLGTRVYIEGYGFGVAHDTGGAIKGNIIDVFMPNRDAAYTWGRKKGVKIYILD